MRFFILLALLAPSFDETDTARADLENALTGLDRHAAERAWTAILVLNNDRCPEALLSAFRHGLTVMAALERDRKKQAKEMELHEPQRDKEGRFSGGDLGKHFAARRAHDLLAMKVEVLQGALPRVASQLTRLTSIKGLAAVLRNSTDWYPRACAADGLGRINDPAAIEALLARAKAEDSVGVRVAIADALGARAKASPEARQLLLAWTESASWQIRLAAAQGLARSGDRTMAWPLINLLSAASGRMRYELNECLKTLTGVNKNSDTAAWKDWWERYREEFLDGTYSPRGAERTDVRGLSTFYGLPLYSTRLAFVIDSSLSMLESTEWKPDVGAEADRLEGDRAIDVARFELRKIIRRLPENSQFNIIAVWGRVGAMGERLTTITRASREISIKYIQGLEQKPGTDLYAGLVRALDHSGGGWNVPPRDDSIDTVYVLSDGVPSVGFLDRAQIPERVLDAVRYKKIVIHAVAVGAPPVGRDLLRKLADGSGGQYVMR